MGQIQGFFSVAGQNNMLSAFELELRIHFSLTVHSANKPTSKAKKSPDLKKKAKGEHPNMSVCMFEDNRLTDF